MRSPSHRLGALWLGLLLQVFTFSGFLHPCCLLGGGGAMSVHAGAHAVDGDGGLHGDAAHGHGPHDDAGPGGAELVGHADAAGGPHSHGGAYGVGDHPEADAGDPSDQECPDCDGVCGLCCQRPGAALAPSGAQAGGVLDAPAVFAAASEPAASPRTPIPAFLLPFANGPPLSPVANA
jgi:hypothetical protein